jgi:hypothetical protein
MPDLVRITLIATAAISGLSLLLLIISVATPVWLDDGNGDTIGLFRQCYGSAYAALAGTSSGCSNQNQAPQAGLSIVGLLLLVFSIVAVIASMFIDKPIILWAGLGLLYFSSMFIMSTYATWGVNSRSLTSYLFPLSSSAISTLYGTVSYTSMGYSYNLCVAAHYFLWTALTILAFSVGHAFGKSRDDGT